MDENFKYTYEHDLIPEGEEVVNELVNGKEEGE